MEERSLNGRARQSVGEPLARRASGEHKRTTLSRETLFRDVQSVLVAAVERVHDATGSEWSAAWALRENGEPYVAAAIFVGRPPVAPDRNTFDLLAALPGPTNLLEPGQSAALQRAAKRHHCSAATPVSASDETPMAVLLVGDRGAPTRPRVLAALDAARRRLETPLAAARAMERLRTLDEEVCRLDRLAALGILASEIVHELRNPLVSIKTFLQLLPERRDDTEFFTNFFAVVAEELRRMERLLDLVLDHGRPGSAAGCDSSADVATVLDSVVELVRHRASRRGIFLSCDAAPDLLNAALGEDSLRQVILNLAMNAIDATPDGASVRLGATAEGDGLAIVVADEGPGIPEELRGLVFEPFFSTRSDRSGGLGLAITRRIVDNAGGTISVGESQGGGAEFRVWLPAADEPCGPGPG